LDLILKKTEQEKRSRGIYDIIYNAKYNTKGIGAIYFERLSEYDDFIKFIHDNGVVSLPIKSIKSKGIKKVYDLSVGKHQYFLANGFIVHNCYGLSKYGLARRLSITEKAADDMIHNYFKRYTGVKRFLDSSARDAVMKRYTTTIAGRRRNYRLPSFDHPDFKKKKRAVEREGKNAVIQGCLAAGTVVKGIGAIEESVGEVMELETGFGSDFATGVASGNKPVMEVVFSNGAKLQITKEHAIPVLRDNGDFVDVPVSNLLGDDFVFVPLNVTPGEVNDISGYKYEKKHWRETYVDYKLPGSMDERLAFVVGCLIGDGSYTKHNHFRFVCSEYQIELMYKFNNYVEELFGYTPVVKRITRNRVTALYTSQVSSVVIRGFFNHIGLGYVKHRNKTVPEYFYTESVENRGALLNGLFSTDGGFTKKSGPNFTSSSKQVANAVHQLLFSFGINSNLKEYIEGNAKVYRIQVPKRFNSKFKKYIGFSVNSKNELLFSGCEAPKFGDGIVPEFIPKTIYKVLRKSPTYFEDFTYNEKTHLRRFKLGKCSFSSWRVFYNRLPECEEKDRLSKYLNYDFCKVKKLIYVDKIDTYDMVCEKIHYFVANGIIVHNSNVDTIKEAMIIAVNELEKRNMKSKLLLTVHDEIVIEAPFNEVEEARYISEQALINGFGKYFSLIPMEADGLVGPVWLKNSCENRENGKKCGGTEMEYAPDEKYGTKIVCKKCGAMQ
jgi:intein/homing endonuclease